SPDTTAIFAPGGRLGGASPHLTADEASMTCCAAGAFGAASALNREQHHGTLERWSRSPDLSPHSVISRPNRRLSQTIGSQADAPSTGARQPARPCRSGSA